MNPFEEKITPEGAPFDSFCSLYETPYDPREVDPYTKCRIILMNGTEFEAAKFSHQMARHVQDHELRRELAMTRRTEQQQQKRLACLKPIGETTLEHTISYEQLAVDLTAHLSKRVCAPQVRQALDLALLEDFDHLYRYANLMETDTREHAELLVGRYTEITPGRPTISEHRYPKDGVPQALQATAPLFDKLAAMIITAAEQQTMNYYMNIAGFYDNDVGRKLYQEIGMIEEQHVTQYEALQAVPTTWLEGLLMHEYTECYLYWSCEQTETDEHIRRVWTRHLEQELAQLHRASQLLDRFEHKHWQQLIPDPTFPAPIRLESNVDYVRSVITTVQLTYKNDSPAPVQELGERDPFFVYQGAVHNKAEHVASHAVIDRAIRQAGRDYRFELAPHPVAELQSRTQDNTQIGRDPQIPGYTHISEQAAPGQH